MTRAPDSSSAAARAVVFDFDGTIADTETPLFIAWSELYAAHGELLDLELWQSIIGTDDGYDPWVELERLAGPLDPTLDEARRARRDELIDRAGVRAGVLDWLDEADRLGIPVGIASSSPNDWVEAHLDRLGLAARFAVLACADGTIPGKPDPTSYREACRALGADPARSIAVEDSPNGIAAATTAGLFTIAVPHGLTEALDLSRADLLVSSLADISLAELLERV